MSSSPSYIVPAHPLVAPPVLFRQADFRASPFLPTDWPSPSGSLCFHPLQAEWYGPSFLPIGSYGETRPAARARRCLRRVPFSLLIPTLSLACSARRGGCHHCLAPRVLPSRVPRLSGGLCPRSSWRAQPRVS